MLYIPLRSMFMSMIEAHSSLVKSVLDSGRQVVVRIFSWYATTAGDHLGPQQHGFRPMILFSIITFGYQALYPVGQRIDPHYK